MNRMRRRQFLRWSISIILAAAAVAAGVLLLQRKTQPAVFSFDECVQAGYPVRESYPAQCVVPDGTVFIQEIPR